MAEIEKLKLKLEEVEDDIERLLGSRENEKATVDERVRTLQEELDRVRKETSAEVQKAQGQVDFLRNDAKLQRESNEALQRQLQRAQEDNRDLRARATSAEDKELRYLSSLQDAHNQLHPGKALPSNDTSLIDAITSRSGDLLAELDSHKRDLAIAKSDTEASQSTVSSLQAEISALKEKLNTEEMEAFQLREDLGQERARFGALEAELADERAQLSSLREKMADGETGSEALKSRVEEEERKVTGLSEELAAKQSQVGSLEEELRSLQERLQMSKTSFGDLTTRFDARSLRAKDLTQRLYAQNDRLSRLLERLSFSVTRQGDSTIIQKMPRSERSANDSSDPGTSMRKSITGGDSIRKAMADSGDLELLYWMNNDDSEIELDKYNAYLETIGNFDIEAFSEAITKQVINLEHTARKYRKDARAYRDKSHTAQKEAHEKIAFKNFKEGDLALFLPTRSQANGAWAAFNVGAPHYFLREQDSHKLRTRDWLLARIQRVQERVVDLSKSVSSYRMAASQSSHMAQSSTDGESFEDDNPFDLSDGLRWYLIDAAEEKPGAPSTPGLAKSTVAASSIDATGSIRRTKKSSSGGVVEGVSKTLSKSLDSRRSSSNSKKAIVSKPGSVNEGQRPASVVEDPSAAAGQEVRDHPVDNLMGP
jgi:autophagy-related protein 11